jgi:hypothetical protein
MKGVGRFGQGVAGRAGVEGLTMCLYACVTYTCRELIRQYRTERAVKQPKLPCHVGRQLHLDPLD